MSALPERAETLLKDLHTGITQSELWRRLNLDSKDGSKLARRLEKLGLIARQRILYNGRWTYLIKAENNLSADLLRSSLLRFQPPTPALDFKAPNLTPRIAEAVRLRLQGLTIKQIAEAMRVGKGTVDIYLRYARRPELFYEERDRRIRGANKLDADAVALLDFILERDGFILARDKPKGMSVAKFWAAVRALEEEGRVQMVSFYTYHSKYRIWEIFGDLANRKLIYRDRKKVARWVGNYIWSKFHSRYYDKNLHRALTYNLKQVFDSDIETYNLIRQVIS